MCAIIKIIKIKMFMRRHKHDFMEGARKEHMDGVGTLDGRDGWTESHLRSRGSRYAGVNGPK